MGRKEGARERGRGEGKEEGRGGAPFRQALCVVPGLSCCMKPMLHSWLGLDLHVTEWAPYPLSKTLRRFERALWADGYYQQKQTTGIFS